MAVSLDICAAAGLAFYIVLGAIAVQVIIALVGAVIALESLVLSWAGVLLALGEIEVSAAEVATAVFALVTLLGVQASQINTLRSQLVNQSLFPGGHWPSAVVESYSDATVTDGDAKWSISN